MAFPRRPWERDGKREREQMSYTVDCPCGKQIEVSPASAGGSIACRCGREVVVPPLSQLRKSAGQGEYEAGTIDTIRLMTKSGELPAGDLCAVCLRQTSESIFLNVACERVWTRTRSHRAYLALFFGLLFHHLLLSSFRDEKEPERFGRDVVVLVPLRLCAGCLPELKRASQKKLKRILGEVPVYKKLLEEYPGASISIAKM
jgi:hypothetical protein